MVRTRGSARTRTALALIAVTGLTGSAASARPDGHGAATACAIPPTVAGSRLVGPASGEIAFATLRNGTSELYTMNHRGGDQRAVTRTRPVPAAVDWSSGCRFAFTSWPDGNSSTIWTASPDTRELQRIGPGFDPVLSPDGTRLAFTRQNSLDFRDPANGVYVSNADGTGLQQVASVPDAGKPSWSPEGAAIAFADGDGVVRVDLASARTTPLTGHNEVLPPEVAWSPDGSSIAFIDAGDVWTVSSDGGGDLVKVTETETSEEGIAWHPDGRLTFLRGGGPGGLTYTTWIARRDGTDSRRLFAARLAWPPRIDWSPDGAYAVLSSQFGGPVRIASMNGAVIRRVLDGDEHAGPAWARAGRRLAFTTRDALALLAGRRLTTLAGTRCSTSLSWETAGRRLACEAGSSIDLITLQSPTRATQRALLTDRGIGDPSKRAPDWEPNGRRLVYVEPDAGTLALHEVGTPQGPRGPNRRVVPLRGLRAAPRSPEWSPDARRIAFAVSCENVRPCTPGIFVVGVDGRRLRRVASSGDNPAWNPAGTKIVFDSTRNGNRDVYVVDATGNNLRRLTTSPAADFAPAWRGAP